jgi:Ni2+-binding GTPase involved in maturation of urease and hydrogenase
MFAAASLTIINKIDLMPYVTFDMARCVQYAQRVSDPWQGSGTTYIKGRGRQKYPVLRSLTCQTIYALPR